MKSIAISQLPISNPNGQVNKCPRASTRSHCPKKDLCVVAAETAVRRAVWILVLYGALALLTSETTLGCSVPYLP